MANRLLFVLTCFCAILTGCASPVGGTRVDPESGRALVVGWGNTASEAANLIYKPALGMFVSNLNVAKVNAGPIPYGQNIARVAPGEHDLTISCGIYIDDRFFGSASVLHANLIAGHVYRLRAQPEARKCYPYLEDITGRQ